MGWVPLKSREQTRKQVTCSLLVFLTTPVLVKNKWFICDSRVPVFRNVGTFNTTSENVVRPGKPLVWPQLVHCVNTAMQFSSTITNLCRSQPASTNSLLIIHYNLLILATPGNFPLQVGHIWFRVATPGSSVTPTSSLDPRTAHSSPSSPLPDLRPAVCQGFFRGSCHPFRLLLGTSEPAMWGPQRVAIFLNGYL